MSRARVGDIRSRIRACPLRSLCSARELREHLLEIRARGWCLVSAELEAGLSAVAAPIHDRTGRVVAAINVSTHTDGRLVGSWSTASLICCGPPIAWCASTQRSSTVDRIKAWWALLAFAHRADPTPLSGIGRDLPVHSRRHCSPLRVTEGHGPNTSRAGRTPRQSP